MCVWGVCCVSRCVSHCVCVDVALYTLFVSSDDYHYQFYLMNFPPIRMTNDEGERGGGSIRNSFLRFCYANGKLIQIANFGHSLKMKLMLFVWFLVFYIIFFLFLFRWVCKNHYITRDVDKRTFFSFIFKSIFSI